MSSISNEGYTILTESEERGVIYQNAYNNLCGCLFCGIGSKYKQIIEETDDIDDESDQQLV